MDERKKRLSILIKIYRKHVLEKNTTVAFSGQARDKSLNNLTSCKYDKEDYPMMCKAIKAVVVSLRHDYKLAIKVEIVKYLAFQHLPDIIEGVAWSYLNRVVTQPNFYSFRSLYLYLA